MERNFKNSYNKELYKNNDSYFDFIDNDLLINSAIKKFNYYPKTTFFDKYKSDIQIPENKNFEKNFINFVSFFQNLDISFSEFVHEKNNVNYDLNKELRHYILKKINKYDKEIINFVGYYWKSLDKKVKSHTIIFLFMVNEYIKKNNLSDYDKNILYWAILFHDMGKFHEMNKYYKEDFSENVFIDKAHPFKSIIVFIQTLITNKLIFFQDEKEKLSFINFFQNEFTDAIYKSFEKEISRYNQIIYNIGFNNFDNIEKFLLKLKTHEENKWIYEIAILIIFHQSLPNNDKNYGKHFNKPLLDEKYISEFFDIKLLELMRIILIYDSSSHCLFKNTWKQKIDKHFDLLKKKLFENI